MTHQTKPNSWVFQDAASTLLSYALQINPAPFTVSIPNENPVTGSLEFVITNGTGSPLSVTYVEFIIQAGTNSDCITQSTADILTSVNDSVNWNVVGPSSPVTNGPATYTLEPTSGQPYSLPAGASVVVQIFGFQTIETPGNSNISIKEMIVTSVGPPPVSTPGFTSFTVTTFPTGFYFKSLATTVQSGSSLIPVAQINAGSTVTLTWNSSVVDTSAFTIYYSSALNGQQTAKPSDVGEWVSPPLTCDTVFTVSVTLSIGGGQPLTAMMTTVISVQNPSLVATAISTGTATISGAASVGGLLTTGPITSSGLISSGSAAISGALSAGSAGISGALSSNSLSVANALTSASATVSGTVTTGTLSASSANVSGTVNTSTVITNALTVNDIINASGGANLNGTISLAGSNGNVGIGGNVPTNATLTVTNTQTSGYGLSINAPYMGSSGYALYIIGRIMTVGSSVQLADINLKEQVKPYTDGLDKVLKINPIKFQYKKESGLDSKKEYIGVSAQDLQEVAPYLVDKTRINTDAQEEYLSMDKDAMLYMLINSVKELKAELDALKAEKKK